MHRVRDLRIAIKEVQRLGGDITYAHHVDPPGPKWVRLILGDDFFVEVTQIQLYTDEVNDATLAVIAKLPRIDSLIVKSDGVTNKGLAVLAHANGLMAVDIRSANVTAAGYLQLKDLASLRSLILRQNTAVNDTWLADILELKQVRYLTLRYSGITNRGLEELQQATWLDLIDLMGTKVSPEGVKQLQQALPKCRIVWP